MSLWKNIAWPDDAEEFSFCIFFIINFFCCDFIKFFSVFFCRRKSILIRAQIWKKCDFFFCIFCHLKSLTIKNFVAIKYKNSSFREFFCYIRIRFLFNAHFDVTILFYTMILDISPPNWIQDVPFHDLKCHWNDFCIWKKDPFPNKGPSINGFT